MNMEERISRLERQNHRLRAILGGALLVGIGALIVGQAAPSRDDVANIIRARRIEVVAEDGRPAVILGMTAGGTGTVTTLDSKNNKIVTLGVTRGGEGAITTGNGKGNDLVKIGVTTEGEGVLITNNAEGRKLIEIGVTVDGQPKLYTFKPDGSPKAQWP